MTHSEEEGDNLNDFPSSAPEVFIETSTSANSTSQHLTDSNLRKRKTSHLTSGKPQGVKTTMQTMKF